MPKKENKTFLTFRLPAVARKSQPYQTRGKKQPKTAILTKFWIFGAPVPTPFADLGPMWHKSVEPWYILP